MPYISDTEWAETQAKLSDLVNRMEKMERVLKNVKGEPIIQGCAGKRLDLNENINAVSLLKRITDIETRVTVLETP